jgi:hypothetical protein
MADADGLQAVESAVSSEQQSIVKKCEHEVSPRTSTQRYFQATLPFVEPMCVSGHCAPHSRFSYAIVWGTYDMWMSRGSRAWSQWGVVRRFHVLLACRKFWFSNIRSKEAEERLLRLQQLFSSPASSVDSPIYILRYLSITFATDPAKTKTIQGSADDKAPLRKRFFRQIARILCAVRTCARAVL